MSVSTSVACWLLSSICIQEWQVKDSTDPGFYFLYCGTWKLYPVHVLYITRSIIIPFLRKVQGIRNDDQSLSPVTPLVSLSFLIP